MPRVRDLVEYLVVGAIAAPALICVEHGTYITGITTTKTGQPIRAAQRMDDEKI